MQNIFNSIFPVYTMVKLKNQQKKQKEKSKTTKRGREKAQKVVKIHEKPEVIQESEEEIIRRRNKKVGRQKLQPEVSSSSYIEESSSGSESFSKSFTERKSLTKKNVKKVALKNLKTVGRKKSLKKDKDRENINYNQAEDRPNSFDKETRKILLLIGHMRHELNFRKRPPISEKTFHSLSNASRRIFEGVINRFQYMQSDEETNELTHQMTSRDLGLSILHQNIVDRTINFVRRQEGFEDEESDSEEDSVEDDNEEDREEDQEYEDDEEESKKRKKKRKVNKSDYDYDGDPTSQISQYSTRTGAVREETKVEEKTSPRILSRPMKKLPKLRTKDKIESEFVFNSLPSKSMTKKIQQDGRLSKNARLQALQRTVCDDLPYSSKSSEPKFEGRTSNFGSDSGSKQSQNDHLEWKFS